MLARVKDLTTTTPQGRRFPWIAIGLALAVSAAAFALDAQLSERMTKVPRPVKQVFSQISHYGDWPYLAGVGVVLWVGATAARRPGGRRVLLAMIVASTLAGIAANAVRGTTGRTRPEAARKGITPGWYGLRHDGQWLVGRNRYNSFPSGHSATAAGFFGVLLFLRRPVPFLVGLMCLIPVPLARLMMNQHHLSDVVVGSAVGLFVAGWVWTRWSLPMDGWWMRTLGHRVVRRNAP